MKGKPVFSGFEHGFLHPPWVERVVELAEVRLSNGESALNAYYVREEHGPRTPWSWQLQWKLWHERWAWNPASAHGLSARQDAAIRAQAEDFDRMERWLLSDASKALSDQEMRVGAMRYLEGMSVERVSDTLGVEVKTVESYLFRLKQKARWR